VSDLRNGGRNALQAPQPGTQSAAHPAGGSIPFRTSNEQEQGETRRDGGAPVALVVMPARAAAHAMLAAVHPHDLDAGAPGERALAVGPGRRRRQPECAGSQGAWG
jgi:hypothetical protein